MYLFWCVIGVFRKNVSHFTGTLGKCNDTHSLGQGKVSTRHKDHTCVVTN